MERDGGRRGEDQMGKGGAEPGRAGVKKRGEKSALKERKAYERGVGRSGGNVGMVSDGGLRGGLQYKGTNQLREARENKSQKTKI